MHRALFKGVLLAFAFAFAFAPGLGCGGARDATTASGPSSPVVAGAGAAGSGEGSSDARARAASEPRAPASRGAPTRRLTIDEARKYMVELVNRDRATKGLAPVALDPGPPTVAGQEHADDMAAHGYLGHWGSDGSTPEERYTNAGGADMVLENAACFIDERARKLDPKPLVDPAEIERTESMFFNETPPNDGHRRNILKPQHTHVGIGVAQPVSTETEIAVPCFSQEFVDEYGIYAPVPRRAKVGQVVRVAGELRGAAKPAGVGVARVDAPRPLPVAELNRRRSYPVPAPYQMYWPLGFKTPIPLVVAGKSFHIDVPLNDKGEPGTYEISVWATVPGSNDVAMVGLRTILVER